MSKFKSVTKDEFEVFLDKYPRKLVRNVTSICEPPLVSFNDFERAPYWPDSVVAKYVAFTSYEDDRPTNFSIISDVAAPIEDDGTRDTDNPVFDKNGLQVKEGDRIRAHWGGSFTLEGGHIEHFREHTVEIKDKGTKYERWSFDDCYNNLRGFDFEVISATR